MKSRPVEIGRNRKDEPPSHDSPRTAGVATGPRFTKGGIKGMKVYFFFRGPMFYPVVYQSDADAQEGARRNSGTRKVETEDGRIIWKDGKCVLPNAN